MKTFNLILILSISLLASSNTLSHQVELDEHTQLIPIPPYDRSYSQASGSNALLALNELLKTFPDELKTQVSFELGAQERHQWSNLPAGPVPRHGVNLALMTDEQRSLLFKFLSASLSESGYRRIADTMAAEAFLSNDAKATKFKWAPENFWLAIYGEPSNTSKWAWSFSGHHLAINISIDANKVTSMSPHFVGVEPARFTLNDIEYDAIVDLQEAGYAIFNSLNETQKISASLTSIPREVLVGPKKDGFIPDLEGLNVGEMTFVQQDLVLQAIIQWVSQQPAENATPTLQQIKTELSDTYFGWAGDVGITSQSYFRIQGPSLIIELLGGMRTVGETARNLGHFHTIYREPGNDYGRRIR